MSPYFQELDADERRAAEQLAEPEDRFDESDTDLCDDEDDDSEEEAQSAVHPLIAGILDSFVRMPEIIRRTRLDDGTTNLLARRHAVQRHRRFAAEPVMQTGFGSFS